MLFPEGSWNAFAQNQAFDQGDATRLIFQISTCVYFGTFFFFLSFFATCYRSFSREVMIYVSSNYEDFVPERDALHGHVFPKIVAMAQARGIQV